MFGSLPNWLRVLEQAVRRAVHRAVDAGDSCFSFSPLTFGLRFAQFMVETAQMLNMLLRVRKPRFRKAAWKGGNSFGKR